MKPRRPETLPPSNAAAGSQQRSDLAQQVHAEQVAQLLKSAVGSLAAALITVVIFSAFLHARLGNPGLIAWAGAMGLLLLARYVWARRGLAHPYHAAADPGWLSVYLVLLAISGLAWGLVPLLFFDPADLQAMAFMFLVLLGSFSGAMIWAASVRSAIFAFGVPMMTLFALAQAIQPDTIYRVGSVLTLLYMLSAIRFALQFHKLMTDSLTARFEKLSLADKLARQVTLVEAASQEKSRFLAAASHDLRQPLHAIALFSAALERELQPTPHHLTASRLLKSVRALGKSLDTMLDISRLDAGVVKHDIRPVAVQSIFQSLNNVFQPQAVDLGLELRIRASDAWVMSDPQLLERLLANLVGNALKYTPHGGVLVVARHRREQVWIEVRDTGVGVPPDQQERIFDEFYQLHNPGRDRSKGLGIGLSIVRRISHLLRHPVQVISREGQGSCFRLALSSAAPSRLHASAFDGQRSGMHSAFDRLPRRVLALDNETDILEALASFLAAYDIQVTGVTSIQAAREALAGEGPAFDLLLCDLRLSAGEDGLDFALEMRTRMPRLRMLMVTGETAQDNLQRVRDSGISVLFKPLTPGALLDALMAPHRAS